MKWIKTGRQIGQAVKNVGRLRQITVVFARHGFIDVVERMGLHRFLPGKLGRIAEAEKDMSVAQRLRISFEELGPTFVKLGQLLSTRPDLLPEDFIEELTRLQDNVQPLPFETIKKVIEEELERPLESAYLEFNPDPLASASIAQVHEARLHTGERVVVKVQRPDLDRIIGTDVSILAFLARLLERYVPESRIVQPSVVVDEFFRTLSQETDFRIEANNISRIADNMSEIEEIVIPHVYKSLSTTKTLTLQRIEGIRVSDTLALDKAGIDRKRIVEVGARAFFKSVLIDGLFHGDLHGGNLFILPGNRLGIIDFGIVGRLSQKSRDQFANMVMSLLTEDYENLCYQYAELGAAGHSIDFEGFQREVRNTLSPYLGMPISEMNIGRILIEATRIATKYRIRVPGDWMIVFKAILTIEGMARMLDPDFDLMTTGEELVKELVKNQYSPQRLTKDFLWVAKDLAALLQVLPRQIRWMFRKFNSDDFAFEIKIPQLDSLRKEARASSKRSSLSLLAAGLFVAGSLALPMKDFSEILGIPYPAFTLFAVAILVLLRVLLL